jgi:hypothetical protein
VNCYYVVASLPTLALGEPPPFPCAEAPRRLANVLDPEQLMEVELFAAGREAESVRRFAAQWLEAETQIRNFCAKIRAGARNVEPQRFLRAQQGYAVWIERAVTDAFSRPHPLERELALDRCRWKVLDELTADEPFAFEAVLAWILKLRMVERWASLKEDVGRARFEEIAHAVQKTAPDAAGRSDVGNNQDMGETV